MPIPHYIWEDVVPGVVLDQRTPKRQRRTRQICIQSGKKQTPGFLYDSNTALPTKPMSTEAKAMLESLKDLCPEMFIIDYSGKLVGCASAGAFVIPKNKSMASFIFHLVALNNKTCDQPPSFTHPMIEALAKLLQERKLE